jgi:hypothetical protein
MCKRVQRRVLTPAQYSTLSLTLAVQVTHGFLPTDTAVITVGGSELSFVDDHGNVRALKTGCHEPPNSDLLTLAVGAARCRVFDDGYGGQAERAAHISHCTRPAAMWVTVM